MDRCVTEEETMDNMYTRKYNYEFIDDMCTQWNTPQSQTKYVVTYMHMLCLYVCKCLIMDLVP